MRQRRTLLAVVLLAVVCGSDLHCSMRLLIFATIVLERLMHAVQRGRLNWSALMLFYFRATEMDMPSQVLGRETSARLVFASCTHF